MKSIQQPSMSDCSESSSLEDDPAVTNRSEQTTTNPDSTIKEESRDEVKELEKLSKKDTNRIRFWRIVIFVLLMVTAAAVTVVTFHLLKAEEYKAFEVAYEQFSASLTDSAIRHQENIRFTFSHFSEAISASAISLNASFPFFTTPHFETNAADFREAFDIEEMTVFNLVKEEQRKEYEAWAYNNYQSMAVEGHMTQYANAEELDLMLSSDEIFAFVNDEPVADIERDGYVATWSYSPPPATAALYNWNLASIEDYRRVTDAARALKSETVVTRVRPHSVSIGTTFTQEQHEQMHSNRKGSSTEHPHSFFFHAIRADPDDSDSEVVAVLGGALAWDAALQDLLPVNVAGIHAVISNDCNQSYTYEIDGEDAFFIGEGDFHSKAFDSFKVEVALNLHTRSDFSTVEGHCQYKMAVYPSEVFQSAYYSLAPMTFAVSTAVTFALILVVFFFYDLSQQRRNRKLIKRAAKSNAIVSSMFPEAIRDRLIGDQTDSKRSKPNRNPFSSDAISGDDSGGHVVADLFTDTTVLFADIAGFTSWSSSRAPQQVFQLLETLYAAFDEIAKRRRVFKVETVGDCYVAACGIPQPRKDHAVQMTRFARDILSKMYLLTRDLEVTLGPDTADLALRIGLHSGSVTAGVLRGERSRFQLFGDTMNVTARMESNGAPDRIHCSEATAGLLRSYGKEKWLQARETKVQAKGKGELQTYWVVPGRRDSDQSTTSSVSDHSTASPTESTQEKRVDVGLNLEKKQRLISWNTDSLLKSLKQVLAHRQAMLSEYEPTSRANLDDSAVLLHADSGYKAQDVLHLQDYKCGSYSSVDTEEVEISEEVQEQCRQYVTCIANMYSDSNEFHNFEHASHVSMSVIKLLGRIVRPEIDTRDKDCDEAKLKHDTTFGITSDPLTQFAASFAALVHDVDHSGVPNAQLVAENLPIAQYYNGKSVAENNSLSLALELLLDESFVDLRRAIYTTQDELVRFRELLVNIVLATDIADKQLKELRNNRWRVAFEDSPLEESAKQTSNRKATIVLEHLIQASDVAHTMQHWHVYRKWNERFFFENVDAFEAGRAAKHPKEFWYQGEMGFFDFYIIPLAKKLKECGVFGVSSDEYLNYAIQNRAEWEDKGQQVVAEMTANAEKRTIRKAVPN